MKSLKTINTTLAVLVLSAFSISTSAKNATGDTASTSALKVEDIKQESGETHFSINTQFGMAAFEKDGAASQNNSEGAFVGGLTFDIGEKSRVLETGLTYFQANTSSRSLNIRTSYLAIPLNAKFYIAGEQQGLYIKTGMLTSFLVGTNNSEQTRNFDLIGNIGLGGKLNVSKNMNFIIEGTYNRGFIDSLKADGNSYNQGLLITAGVAFDI